jgi:hypothetical protein
MYIIPIFIIFPLLGLRVVGVEARGRRREECGAQRELRLSYTCVRRAL